MMGELRDKDICLRQMNETELDQLLIWANDPKVLPFWYGRKLTIEDLSQDWTSEYFDEDDGSGRCFIIEYEGNKIGMINHNGREGDGSFEIDIIIGDSSLWSGGLGTRVLRLFCTALFIELKASRIFVVTGSMNPRAIRAYEKAGFIRSDISDLKRKVLDPAEDTYLALFP